ncbi:MAG: hypothetical protein E7108_04695 [Bacteroidales bacterium]|jgi:hypothetical protein|nr:hypothetical protein [Bacteroidales bacterium]
MSNLNSEQIRSDLRVEVAPDQVFNSKEQEECLKRFLGEDNCERETILGRKVLVYNNGGKSFILLHKAVTYLGGNGQHPLFKKRVQLPFWYKSFCNAIRLNNLDYDVRFIGVYHFEGLVIFIDFVKDTYLKRRVHNSSAHIYINDLYQALKYGVFHKEDQFGNHIFTIRSNKLEEYLKGKSLGHNYLFSLFEKFNKGFVFGRWLNILPAVKEMKSNQWPNWRQSEWPGWFLEYRFNKFTIDKDTAPSMVYTGLSNKGHNNHSGIFDFDIWFKEHSFYGDLKASDINKNEAPGNDQQSFIECINMFGRFWYVIYEHETLKDSQENDFKTVRAYNKYISSVTGAKKDELSYANRLKIGVKFLKMTILELNQINYREALSIFNQGHQPNGSARNPKFLIKKKDIDSFVVFRYRYRVK